MPPANSKVHPSFESIYWRSLGRMTDTEIDLLAPFVELRTLVPGEVFCDLDQEPEGVFFVGTGFVSVVTRLPNGLVSNPIIVGRGRVFGEGAFTVIDVSAKAVPMRITAVRPATCWVLPRARVPDAIAAVPAFERALRRAIVLRGAMGTFAEALRQTRVLSGTPIPALTSLVMGADLEIYAAGKTILKAGARSRGIFMLVQGKATCFTKHEEGESKGILREGMMFGGLRHTLPLEPESVVAVDTCVCLRVGSKHLAERIATSPALRRVAGGLPVFAATAARGANLIMVMGDRHYPLSNLAYLAAAELVATYKDSCALVRLRKEGSKLESPEEREGVMCSELAIGAATASARVAEMRDRFGALEFVIIDPGDLPIHEIAAVGKHLSRVAMVVNDTFVDPPAHWRADSIA